MKGILNRLGDIFGDLSPTYFSVTEWAKGFYLRQKKIN